MKIKRSKLKELAIQFVGNDSLEAQNQIAIKIATAMCARTSYTVIGEGDKKQNYVTDVELHDRMANQVPFHASPFEHCARAMTDEEYGSYTKTSYVSDSEERYFKGKIEDKGHCRNFKGFIQYRHILETNQ